MLERNEAVRRIGVILHQEGFSESMSYPKKNPHVMKYLRFVSTELSEKHNKEFGVDLSNELMGNKYEVCLDFFKFKDSNGNTTHYLSLTASERLGPCGSAVTTDNVIFDTYLINLDKKNLVHGTERLEIGRKCLSALLI